MSVKQTQRDFIALPTTTTRSQPAWRQLLSGAWPSWRTIGIAFAIIISLSLLGRNEFSAVEARDHAVRQVVKEWDFDFIGWEVNALSEKVATRLGPASAAPSDREAAQLVIDYLERAQRMWQIDGEITLLLSEDDAGSAAALPEGETPADPALLQEELDELRAAQQAVRATVERAIEQQVAAVLVAEDIQLGGLVAPPVLFSFTEPPRKLVASPRDQIETVHARILDAEMSLEEVEASEAQILDAANLSAYITNIGGLGVYPTMVVDRASLEWVLSTVAHEWAHNYLTFFPLGANYGYSAEVTILNESVATIFGNEVGAKVLARFYADLLPAEQEYFADGPPSFSQYPQTDRLLDAWVFESAFDFRREMRATRLRVDELLAEGRVDEAEAYMEERRQLFVENGYPLRVLNQAYFAFNGSYVDSPSSSSPIGPKLVALRERSPDLLAYLQTVRAFVTEAQLDEALQ